MTLARGLRLLCLIQQTRAPPATSIFSNRLVTGIVSAPLHGQRQHQRCTTVTQLDAVTACNGPRAAVRGISLGASVVRCHRCGSSSAMRLFGWVGRRLSTSLMYAHGSCPSMRADWIRLITAAARWPARRLPANSQLLRSCEASHDRNKANSTFMRSRHDAVESAPWAGSPQGTDTASHNHSACKNANKALGARYRAFLISGYFSRASARSFMARSASTYM